MCTVWEKLENNTIEENKQIRRVNEPGHEKMCLIPYANNKGADQRSLISAFVVRCQDRMKPLDYNRNFKILAGLYS